MHPVDWAILIGVFSWIVYDGLKRTKDSDEIEGYFLAKRSIPWWAAGLSIIATSFSAASILGVPGYAYASNMWYLQYQLGDILAAIVVAVLFIPFFHKVKGLTTAYEYLEVRFDAKTRLLGSTLFVREPSGLRLTELGERLLRYCQTRDALETELLVRHLDVLANRFLELKL